ncbi:unnamed protein product [Acanthoscelides obtectus]|uniref:RNA polymerase II subunit A C-terminal domain phosphatase SSU72 n=1 Tax=Acanthoscelides obtectus TaxID=200917 RepID=A0A9P0M2W5_ACAOB|nr:unnamed protein product [Acanthoscelides obtectus]CAK1634512.1 RNA polymerase II subunit A C-terminal domain phosphatase SSU72 [Acanthoscelides obtectus]
MTYEYGSSRFLSKKGFDVKSYGTGDKVKIPGSAADKPNIYDFGTSYEEIYLDLLQKDKALMVFSIHWTATGG